jgi:hypothetical protein
MLTSELSGSIEIRLKDGVPGEWRIEVPANDDSVVTTATTLLVDTGNSVMILPPGSIDTSRAKLIRNQKTPWCDDALI